MPSEFIPSDARRLRSRVPAAAALALVAAGASIAFALAAGDPDALQVFLLEWVAVPYIGAGLIAWWCRPQSRLGPLMVAGGFASALSGWQLAEWAGPYTLGAAFDILPAALFLHVCLAFPDGRLRSRFERILVGLAYSSAIGLQLVKLGLGGVDPANLVDISHQPGLVSKVEDVQLLSLTAACLVALALVARRRGLGRSRRRVLKLVIDSFALALVMIAALFALATFDGPGFREVQRVTLFVVGLAPLAFLLGLLDARLARSSLGELILELRREPAPHDLRDALALALRDPSLALAYWLPDFRTYVDLDGHTVTLPGEQDDRTVTRIDRDDEPVAALVHDRALGNEPELLDAVGAAAGMSLENARLQAELRARVEELSGSRARVIEASQRERQRLERNLHDGAQQRLIALSLRLSMLEQRLPAEPALKQGLDAARHEIALSLEELRDVARGIHPAVLSGHGLAVAVESLAVHAPLPVTLTLDVSDRLPERVEVAAYYVVSESLANIGKHARAARASVSLERQLGRLLVEVVDDGVGGADTERGSGLRGLADRVEALGGRLRVWTPLGGGTRVQAEIPCA